MNPGTTRWNGARRALRVQGLARPPGAALAGAEQPEVLRRFGYLVGEQLDDNAAHALAAYVEVQEHRGGLLGCSWSAPWKRLTEIECVDRQNLLEIERDLCST